MHERVAEEETLAASRISVGRHLADTDAVVLKTDGSFSVVENLDLTAASASKLYRALSNKQRPATDGYDTGKLGSFNRG